MSPATGSLTLDASGNIYGATLSSVFKIANDTGRTLSTLATFSGKNGSSLTGGLTLDAAGNIYGTARSGGAYGYGTVFMISQGDRPSAAVLASFNWSNGACPNGNLVLDATGTIYGTTQVGGANAIGGTVFKVANDSARTLTTLVSFIGMNGFQPVAGLTADAAGNLYGVTSRGGQPGNLLGGGTVFRLANDGARTFKTLAVLTGAAGGPWLASGGIAVDAAGNLYGTSTYGGTDNYGSVFKVSSDASRTITTVVSFNRSGTGQYPTNGVAIDRLGNIFGTTPAWRDVGSSQSYVYQLKPTMASNVFAANYSGILATGVLTGTKVQGNAITETFRYGIGLTGATGLLVGGGDGLGNTIMTGTRSPGNTSLLSDGAGVAITGGAAGSVVQGNLISGNAGTGIQLRQATGVTVSRNTVVANGGYGISTDLRVGLTLDGNVLKGNGRGDMI